MEKVSWSGRVLSVQPRIRLLRSFDERGHSYLGYCLIVDGTIGNESREFSVGIDKAEGNSVPVADARREPVEFYRASKLKVLQRSSEKSWNPPPWHGVTPDLETYQWRGHRRLSARTYNSRCQSCIWGSRMAVEMIIDPWNPPMRYRFETFCYGSKSCGYYKAGPRRIVPGRKGMRWEEPDWVDEQETAHRSMDE